MRIWIAVSLLISMYATAGTWYVSPDGDGAGASWDQPSDLQNALVGAVGGD
jgi:hypothetical protein